MIKKFQQFLNEDGGTAMATAGNTGGMGAVTAPQASSTPGDVAGSTAGSGDLPAYDMGTHFGPAKTNKKKKKSKSKKSKKESKGLGASLNDKATMYVTRFSDWDYPTESKND
jgi:hypothetical protein